MGVLEKIELFNKLKEELEEIYGCFDTIEIVGDYTEEMNIDENGTHYYDTGGCMESTPVCVAVKRSDLNA